MPFSPSTSPFRRRCDHPKAYVNNCLGDQDVDANRPPFDLPLIDVRRGETHVVGGHTRTSSVAAVCAWGVSYRS